jgi:ferrous iron transport protein B
MTKTMTIGLVGNPNCGKTTLFNGLTGAKQRVGNWPGVTVERKSGFFRQQDTMVEVVDLPGVYSLVMASETASIDEKVACEYILGNHADLIVNILDASNLERNLYLTLQLLEMQVPMIVVLNMMDVARGQNKRILIDALEKRLGCVVVPVEAHKSKGFKELRVAVCEGFEKSILVPITNNCHPVQLLARDPAPSHQFLQNPNERAKSLGPALGAARDDKLIASVAALAAEITPHITAAHQHRAHWLAMRLLEDDVFAARLVNTNIKAIVSPHQEHIRQTLSEDADILLADARYSFIREVIADSLIETSAKTKTWTARIDSIVLNRALGIPIFLGVMYCMFLFAINVGGAFQDFFDISSDTIFVQGFGHLLASLGSPNWLNALLANGVGKGINTTVTFIPVIGAMFLFLAFLEDSGYMARAAFVVDRGMRALGLPGKSFVPMIVGFGCNVPAVMATRTLENKRDRILTVMMSPFMSCGARLAIYAVFTAAFFPVGGQNVVFALYLIGIAAAMLTGLLLRKTVLKGDPSPLVMELPSYHVPHVKTLFLHAWQRLRNFLFRAGKLIVPICVLIGVLAALNVDGSINTTGDGNANSMLSAVGRFFTPIFSPMGIHQDNWPATVGLVTGVLAKEVVVGTLNALYSQVGHFATLQAAGFSFWGGLHDALISIPQNLSQLGSSFGNPVLAQAPVHSLSQSVYGLMYERFDGQVGAIAYLLFVLLYFPCVSTTAAMLRELNRGWTIFSVLWTTGMAYGVAVGFYQTATFMQHPASSLAWIVGVLAVLGGTIFSVKTYASLQRKPFKTLLPTGEVV